MKKKVSPVVTQTRPRRTKKVVAQSEPHTIPVGPHGAKLVERERNSPRGQYDFTILRPAANVGMLVPWPDDFPEGGAALKRLRRAFRQRVGLAAYHWARRNDAKMHVETHDDGVMVWRTK